MRRSFTSLPVSIESGQASAQVPSAAQVCKPVVHVLALERDSDRRSRRLAGELAAQHDPLPWGRGQVAAGAGRLAEPALDAVVRDLLDLRCRDQVAQVHAGVGFKTTPGASTASGSASSLYTPHQLGRVLAPLALYVGRHVDPGAVLGLQRAVVLAEDQLDQALHERLVALQVLGLREVRGEHEVEVPRRSVAGDAGEEAVLAEERLEVAPPPPRSVRARRRRPR